jgi:uncharacterized membrane protein
MRSDRLNASSGSHHTGEKAFQKIDNSSALSRTLTAAESGTLFAVDMSTVDNNVTLTLPTVSDAIAGCSYDFCFTVNCDDDADFIITTGADATDIYGYVVAGAANSTVDDVDGLSKITVDGSVSQAIEGLRMTFICDGTNWHLSGYIPVAIGTVVLVESASA